MKVLVDSSVWMEHFRHTDKELMHRLDAGDVVMHPYVLGEIALGQFKRRAEILADLKEIEFVAKAEDSEVMDFIERYKFYGSGVGWVDCHLMASARLTGSQLFTHDLALKSAWTKI